MNARAESLINRLKLRPHPEGGWYQEAYRSSTRVTCEDTGQERAALTTIYFLLVAGEQSRWHRVRADEVWHFYEGDPLELVQFSEAEWEPQSIMMGSGDDAHRAHVVPANHWQAARPLGDYALVGCTVAPGFEFTDFTLLSDLPAIAEELRTRLPGYTDLL